MREGKGVGIIGGRGVARRGESKKQIYMNLEWQVTEKTYSSPFPDLSSARNEIAKKIESSCGRGELVFLKWKKYIAEHKAYGTFRWKDIYTFFGEKEEHN